MIEALDVWINTKTQRKNWKKISIVNIWTIKMFFKIFFLANGREKCIKIFKLPSLKINFKNANSDYDFKKS